MSREISITIKRKNMDLNTIFDGWGTELVGLLIGSGIVGYCFYKKGKISQKQKAGNNAKQTQEVRNSQEKEVCQEQEAGDNSEQIQIG